MRANTAHLQTGRYNFFCQRGGIHITRQPFKQNDEFIPANTCHYVGFAYRRLDAGGDLTQQFIAHIVAKGIVNGFELIQVQEQDGKTFLAARGADDGLFGARA